MTSWRWLPALVLLGGGLLVGCAGSPTCGDVPDLTAQLEAADRDDSDYYDIQDRLNQAEADCNS